MFAANKDAPWFGLIKAVALGIGSALLLGGFVSLYLFEIYEVKRRSMAPQFEPGDILMIEKISIRLQKWGAFSGDGDKLNNPIKPKTSMQKGALREIQRGDVLVFYSPLDQKKLLKRVEKFEEGAIFFMGDNRELSIDSRDFGAVPLSSVVGRVFFHSKKLPIGYVDE